MLLEKEELRKDYYERDLNQTEIAKKHDCSRKTVQRRMEEYGFPTLPTLQKHTSETGRTTYKSDGKSFFEYQLIAIADGADPNKVFSGHHVHHINGCTHDNRKQNLVLLSPQEHALIHNSDMSVNYEEKTMYKTLENY